MAQASQVQRALSPTLALCLALIGAAAMTYYHQGLFMPRVVAVRTQAGLGGGYSFGNDYYQVWLSSRELLRQRTDPYSPEMMRDIQMGLYGRLLEPNRPGDPVDKRMFPYPAYADLLFWPTAYISFEVIRVWVTCILAVLTAGSVWLWLGAMQWRLDWRWKVAIALLLVSSYQALEGLYAGQIGLLVAFLLALAMWALQRGRLLLCGFVLALTAVKPQVTGLTVFFLLLWSFSEWRSRRKLVVGFAATMIALLGASLLVLPHWIESWLHTILAYHKYTRPPLVTEVLTSRLGTPLAGPATLALTVASIVVAVVLAWRNREKKADSFVFWRTLAIILCITTITVLPGQAVYDHVILLPAIFLLMRHRRELERMSGPARILLSIGAVILLWSWFAAILLVMLRPLLSAEQFYSPIFFSLPLRAAPPLCFAALALLGWMRRITPSEVS